MQLLDHLWKQALALCIGAFLFGSLSACGSNGPSVRPKPLTAMEKAANVRCDRGLTRIEVVGGGEDGFATTGDEPSRIRPARLPNEYLETVSKAQSGPVQLREYDETGQDRLLIDNFDLPRDVVSGALIIRLRTGGGSDNDGLRLGNLDENDFVDGFNTVESFGFSLKAEAKRPAVSASKGAVLTVPLDKLIPNARARFKGDFIAYLNRTDRPDAVDFEVDDDTAVDVAILILCQKPQVARGTSFAEYRSKIVAPNVSFLSCFLDKTQAPCNPFEGDQLCTALLPLACYKPGNRVPAGLEAVGLQNGYATGGEVRTTAPIAASRFATRSDVDRFCASQFGGGWRALEYHDGAGGAIVSYSSIAPKTRAWVDVSDQRYANCWDMDKAR